MDGDNASRLAESLASRAIWRWKTARHYVGPRLPRRWNIVSPRHLLTGCLFALYVN